MNWTKKVLLIGWMFGFILMGSLLKAALRESPDDTAGDPAMRSTSDAASDESAQSPDMQELMKAKEAMDEENKGADAKKGAQKTAHGNVNLQAEAFIASPDWEFDGFIAGGQDMQVKSIYATNDVIYLNVGKDQGFEIGDKVGIYRRGDRIRDPQTGKFLGFEVHKVANAEVTNRLEKKTCSARIAMIFEAVLIGDLVRKE